VIHLIEGRVIKSRVAELMPLDEFYYLEIVLWRISLTSAHRLFRRFDGIKTPGTMEFWFWHLIQNTVGGAPLPPPSQASLDSQHWDDDSVSSGSSGISSDSPLPSTNDTGIPADIKDQMSQYASDDSSASSSIQAYDRDPALQASGQQRLDVNNPSAKTVAADAQQDPVTTSPDQASTPSGVPSSDNALHFPGYLPPNNVFQPTADEGEELSFPVDAPTVSCKVVENCHLEFLQDIHPDQLSEVKKGYKGILDLSNPGSSTHLAQDAADAAVLMLTLLLNEKPTSAMEAQARAKGLPVQSWVYGVLCIAGRKYNQHLCNILLSPAGFASLKRILAKVAHTNPGALFKVQKKGTKTAATPFSNLWFGSTFPLGSMF